MPSTRCISKPRVRQAIVGMLALFALAVALVCVLPGEKAFAETSGGTTLGIIIIDSSQSGGQGQGGSTGTTTLGIRVTNSGKEFITEYELTLHHNDNTQATSTVKATYNLPLPNTLPLSRTGYTFLGYFDATSGGTQYYKADGTYARVWDQPKAIPLYAQWQAKTTQVSFDQKGGNNGQTIPITATFDAKPSNVAVPDYPGYTFAGYFDDKNKQYFNNVGECVVDKWDKEDESVMLYAHWTLQIDCAIPTSVDIEVDASGTSSTSSTPEFLSSTPADIKVTAVSSMQGAGATSLFANNVVPTGLVLSLSLLQVVRRLRCRLPQQVQLF